MIEKDRSPFGKEQRHSHFEGEEFSPFEEGLAVDVDPEFPPGSEAFGCSPTFYVYGMGNGHIELFRDMKNLVPAEKEPRVDASKLRGYKLIPTIAIPIISFNDPESAVPDIACYVRKDQELYYAENDDRYSSLKFAFFTNWKNVKDRKPATFDFMTLNELKEMKISFGPIEESDYLISNDGFNGEDI